MSTSEKITEPTTEYKSVNYDEFLTRYYSDDILKLASIYPSSKTLFIDFTTIENYDLDLSNSVLEKPYLEKSKIIKALKDHDIPTDIELKDVAISFKNLPPTERITIQDIGSDEMGHLVSIEGRLNKTGPVRVKLVNGAFKCMRCDHVMYVLQPDVVLTEPYECENDVCGRKGSFQLDSDSSTWIDQQVLEIQDLYEYSKPGTPLRNLQVIIHGRDLVEMVPAIGSQVIVTGVIKRVPKKGVLGKTSLFDTVIEADHIESVEPDIDLLVTEEDKKRFRTFADSADVYENLIASTVPSVLGYDTIKLAMLGVSVSGPNYVLPDGRNVRGYTHALLCGDPGTAKTVLIEGIRNLNPRSQYAAGKGSSSVGLTVAVVPDEISGGYSAQAGALVLADKGLMVIDEFDKLGKEDQQALNTVLESSKIVVNKAGLNQVFNARCPVIAISNPKFLRFDPYEDISKQVNIPSDLMSRFDLIYKIQDEPNPINDRAIAEHQGAIWRKIGKSVELDAPLSVEDMRKYLSYAKTFDPEITEDVEREVTNYYLSLRAGNYNDNNNNTSISVTARDNNGMYRVVKSIAKLRLASVCNIEDVQWAITIHKASLDALIDPKTGQIDGDIRFGQSRSQQEKQKAIRAIIIELQQGNGNGNDNGMNQSAFLNDIISVAKTRNITSEDVLASINKHKTQGNILEISEKNYRWVGA